ncbi:MAG: L-aspartate oxidase [Chloroflexi bacterium]|nr:L-aspartate oxidase [Chloroflexota bacterium]
MRTYDYIIVGSGIAGLYTALLALERGRSVLVITKGSIDETNTRYAQGGIAAAVGSDDSTDLHYQDTITAGAGLCDPEAVRVLVEEAPARIEDLVRLGVVFDTTEGTIALGREGAHSRSRILHAGGDATGEKIELTLSHLARMSRVTVLENCLVGDIVVDGDKVVGVRTLDWRRGMAEEFQGSFVVLATGGAGRLFRFTTNSSVATGDGVALAYRAGAEVTDLEFYQFHPTALRLPGAPPFLISEAVRGEGGKLRNASGETFTERYDPRGDLAPRDVVTRAIVSEMLKSGTDRAYLDLTHLPARATAARFPSIYRQCLDYGIDFTKEPIPIAPAAHYMMGGVKTNVWGETSIPGLFACGESACTGVHGANRLASNSLLETVVFGWRVMERTDAILRGQETAKPVRTQDAVPLPERKGLAEGPVPSLTRLQQIMWSEVGIVRQGNGLNHAADITRFWQNRLPPPSDLPSYELGNMVLLGRLMAEAALLREESRGAHYRSDYPQPSDTWLRHITFAKNREPRAREGRRRASPQRGKRP